MATDTAGLVIVLEAQSKKMQNQLVQVTKQIDRFAAQTEKRFQQMSDQNAKAFASLEKAAGGSLDRISAAVAALGVGISVKGILDYANAWQEAGNKVASSAEISGLQAKSLNDLSDAAIKARTDLGTYIDLYTRLLRVAPQVGASEIEIAQATDTVAKSLKISGASAQEQQAALIQLGQALSSGVLQGDELRSLRENAPLLAQEIAKYYKTTVGGLKQLGAQGKLTGEGIVKATLAARGDIDKAFNTTSATINDAVTNIATAFTAYIGNEGSATGATKALVDALQYLATNFKTIAPVVADFAAILAGAFAAKTFVSIAGAIGEASVALTAFLSTMAAGEVTVAGLSAIMGPLALLIGGVAAAYFVLNANQDAARKTAEEFTGAIDGNKDKLDLAKKASVEYRKALRDQIDAQLAAAEAALEEAGAQYKAAQSRADTAEVGTAVLGFIGSVVAGGTKNMSPLTAPDPQAAHDAVLAGSLQSINDQMDNIKKLKAQLGQLDKIDKLPPGTDDHAKPPGGITTPPGTGKADAYDKATASIQKQTDALTAQTAAQSKLNPFVNDYGFAVDKAKAASELLSAAEAAHLKITPDLQKAIDELATKYAQADVASKQLADSQQELLAKTEAWRDTIKGATGSFIDDLVQGKSAADALGDALTNIGNQLLQMGLDQLFGGGTLGDKSKPFGFLGDLLNLNATGGIAAHGRRIPVFANGGISKQASIFGEAGPEAAVPLPDGRRIPVDLRMPQPANDNGAVHVSVPISINAQGADPAAVARLQQTVAQMKAELPTTVVGAVRNAKRRRQL